MSAEHDSIIGLTDKITELTGQKPISWPRAIIEAVDTGCLERIQRQIEKDKRRGYLPETPHASD